jgi:hypothetical protein
MLYIVIIIPVTKSKLQPKREESKICIFTMSDQDMGG